MKKRVSYDPEWIRTVQARVARMTAGNVRNHEGQVGEAEGVHGQPAAPRAARRSRWLKYYRGLGFDRTTNVPFTKEYRIRCSQCEALVINGTPCHEAGCPNAPRPAEEED